MQIPCAVVFAEQPHFPFYVPSDKENDEIMVVDEHPVILTGFAARAHDQVQLDQLLYCPDDLFTLHAGLFGNVSVGVPTDVQLCAVTLAEEQIDQHLTRCQLAEHLSLYKEITAIEGPMLDSIGVCPLVAVCLNSTLHRLYKPLVGQACNDLRYGLCGADTAVCSNGGLLDIHGRHTVDHILQGREAAQVSVYAHFLRVQSLREDLVGEFV